MCRYDMVYFNIMDIGCSESNNNHGNENYDISLERHHGATTVLYVLLILLCHDGHGVSSHIPVFLQVHTLQ